jgi:MFS family permease
MRASLLPVSALLLGVAILLVGAGLQGILVPIRATIEQFGTITIGLLMTAYWIGFVLSCFATPVIVRRVGHIRTFAVLAAVASVVVLVLALVAHPLMWMALRAVSGFSLAGLAMVVESWLNEKATNDTRGRIFSIYMVINLLAVTIGQLMLPLGDPGQFPLFAVVSIAITLSLVPIGLTRSAAPQPIAEVKLRPKRLYEMSPAGVAGCFFVGLSNGAFGGLGPVFATREGLSIAGVALFMSIAVIGGAFAQYPLGRVSDLVDRRRVMLIVSFAAVIVAAALALAGAQIAEVQELLRLLPISPPTLFIVLAGLLGAFIYPLYALCVAHTNDFVGGRNFVEASGGLMLIYGLGSVVGPLLAAVLIETNGASGLFVFVALVHIALGAFLSYRMRERLPIPVSARPEFVTAPTLRATPAAAALDPRAQDQPTQPPPTQQPPTQEPPIGHAA